MYLGPDHLIVGARVALDDDISADQTEDLADAIDKKLTSGCHWYRTCSSIRLSGKPAVSRR